MGVEARRGHRQLLLQQLAGQLQGRQAMTDCVIQCSDGDHYTSTLLLASLSPTLAPLLAVEEPVVVVPGLLLGELLLFLKYLLCTSPRVAGMFSREDPAVLDRVCRELWIEVPNSSEGSRENAKKDEAARNSEPEEVEANAEVETEVTTIVQIDDGEVQTKDEESEKGMKERRAATVEKIRGSVECRWCKEQVRFPLLGKHLRQEHPQQEHHCLACAQALDSREELVQHLETHTEPGPAYLACDRCAKLCISQYQLQQHKKSHNSKQLGSMACPHCERTFQMGSKYRAHLAAHAAGTLHRTLPCVHCDKTFKKQYDLARHLKSHLGIKSHSCAECGESFVDGTRLKQHRWIHLQHRAYRCPAPGCKEAFRHKGHLKSHMASFHPNIMDDRGEQRFDCHLCNRRFAFQYALNTHLEWHKLEDRDLVKGKVEEGEVVVEEGVYECAICGAQFPGINLLGQHCQIHMNEQGTAQRVELTTQESAEEDDGDKKLKSL